MSQKITNDDGQEVEVYTAEEVKAQSDAAVAAKEAEFGKTRTQIEAERDDARKALGERANEFKQFRKLNDETVQKLSVAERTIYENGLVLEEQRVARETADKKEIDARIDASLKLKAGTDEKLFGKMKDMWGAITIEARTPEEIERKTLMVLGAIGTAEPDLVASVAGFTGGSYAPPVAKKEGEGSFADTDRGKQAAQELGVMLEAPKK